MSRHLSRTSLARHRARSSRRMPRCTVGADARGGAGGLTDAGTSRAAEGTAACDSSHFVDELGKAVEQVRRVFGEIGGNAPFVDAGVEKARDVGAILWAIGG